MRRRVADVIGSLEHMYEEGLKSGQPAYDPSWMWAELGLEAEAPEYPPPLAHERVAEQVPGTGEACRGAAERARARPGLVSGGTTLEDDDLRRDLDLQRFVRAEPLPGGEAVGGASAAPYIALIVNFELHRRKVFWVDAALSYMLESTDIDLAGRELRTPFPSFALVFADRYALSLGERLLSRRSGDPLRGQILRVATVYVNERLRPAGRVIDVTFAFDALGADLPSLVPFEVPADAASSLQAFLDSIAPGAALGFGPGGAGPARKLLRLVLNAILYATSAGVTPEVRMAPPSRRPSGSAVAPSDPEAIFFLPGHIDIRRVRQLQELARAPGGGAQLARFMVRGHWRRPAKNWAEQHLRWIEPYWKGPDLAAVMEKAYRLRP